MIFSETWQLILSAGKCQTRRPMKDGETLNFFYDWAGKELERVDCVVSKNNHMTYRVGGIYAVQPARTYPAVLYRPGHLDQGGLVWDRGRGSFVDQLGNLAYVNDIQDYGWQPLRIRITAIRQEPLQSISEADARAEGVQEGSEGNYFVPGSVHQDWYFPTAGDAYADLWDIVKRPKAQRWDANPLVNVYTFEIPTPNNALTTP